MKYTIEQLKNQKIAIHCPTKQDFDMVMIWLSDNHITWEGGKQLNVCNNWLHYKELTCVRFVTERIGQIVYSDKPYYVDRGYKIITVSELFEDNKKEEKMERKVYKADNKQDVVELFQLLDSVYSDISFLQLISGTVTRIYLKDGDFELVSNSNFTFDIDFCGKSEITRPVDQSKWIGKLCWFWDRADEIDKILGILHSLKDGDYPYVYNTVEWQNCRPLTQDEVNNRTFKD